MGLTNEVRFLVFLSIIFSIINNYITIFINLYIWEGHHNIAQVAWFNMAMMVFWAISFLIGGKLFTRYSMRVTIRIASCAAIIAFVLLLTLQDVPVTVWTLLIGGSTGVMCGFYFVSQNLFITLYGHGEDFKTYFAVTSIAQQVLSIINPILFAAIIKWFGYSASFVAICIIVSVLFTLSFFIPIAVVSEEERKKPFFHLQNPLPFVRSYKIMLIVCIVMGAVVQFQVLIIQLFTFTITDNKIMIAGLNVLYTVLTILAFRFVQKKPGISLMKWIKIGGGLLGVSYLLALYTTPMILIIVNILSSLGYFLFMSNWNANQFIYLSQLKPNMITKLVISRELMILLGREVMLFVMAQVEEFQGIQYVGLILFSIISVGLILLIEPNLGKSKKVEKDDAGLSLG